MIKKLHKVRRRGRLVYSLDEIVHYSIDYFLTLQYQSTTGANSSSTAAPTNSATKVSTKAKTKKEEGSNIDATGSGNGGDGGGLDELLDELDELLEELDEELHVLIRAARNGCIESLKSLYKLYREGCISLDEYNDCVNAYQESVTGIDGVVHKEPEIMSPYEVDFTSEDNDQYVSHLHQIIVCGIKCEAVTKEEIIELLELFQSTLDPSGKAETPLAEASFLAVEDRVRKLIRDKKCEDMLYYKEIYEPTVKQFINEVAFFFSKATVFHPYRTDGKTIESESVIFYLFIDSILIVVLFLTLL